MNSTTQHSSELLTSFIHSYNAEQSQLEQQEQMHAIYKANTQDEIALLKSKLEAEKRFTSKLQDEALQDAIDLNKAAEAVENGLIIAKKQTALNKKIETLENQNASLHEQLKIAQKKVTELNQLNPKKLKEQNKRQKEANEKAQARAKYLEKCTKENQAEIKDLTGVIKKATLTIAELKHDLDRSKGTGVYHSGEHHLIIWPQEINIEREDGTNFKGRTLLYLHQSGRGGLLAQDSDMTTHLCPGPKGGLRPSKDTLEFAERWLSQVNEVQGGVVTELDMIPVNLNSKAGDL